MRIDRGYLVRVGTSTARSEMVIWIWPSGCKRRSQGAFKDLEGAFREALFKCPYKYDYDMVRWVACEFDWADENKRSEWTVEVMEFAAKAGKLQVLHGVLLDTVKNDQEEVREACGLILKSDVMNEIAGSGQLADVQWLYYHHDQQCPTKAMDNAAAKGRLDIVRWLHLNRSEGCTTGAMDQAAHNRHLEVVQWLNEYRQEGCTTRAMDLAASNGHLEIVKWLHEHRTEGCTTRVMDLAAEYGHLAVVQFLHANRHEGYTTETQATAAGMGHFELFRWLQTNRSEPFDPEIEEWFSQSEDIYRTGLKCQALFTHHERLG